MFSLESPHRCNSYKYTQCTIVNMKTRNTLNYPKSAAVGFFPGTRKRVRKSHGKRAFSVRATEVLLYLALIGGRWLRSVYSQRKVCPLPPPPPRLPPGNIAVHVASQHHCSSVHLPSNCKGCYCGISRENVKLF